MWRFLILPFLAIPAIAQEKVTFDDHIFPIFEAKCLNCHNPDKKKGDLDLSTYLGTLAGSSGGKVALAGDGGSSKLFTVVVQTEEPVMPPEGDKIPKKDADLIRAWIDGGLLENKGSKAKKPEKPKFDVVITGGNQKPEGPPPMPSDLLLEPVVVTQRATVVADIEASPWAPLIAVTGQRQVILYHSETLEPVGILPFDKGQPETLSFHPSGKYLLAAGGIAGKSGTTITWDITTGKEIMTVGKEFDSVLAADLRADLGGVALGGPSRLLKLWDTQELTPFKSIKKHTDWITALSYSPDGVLLATGDRNNGVLIWEAHSGNEFHSLRGHQKGIVDLKWRQDSNLVASASEDGSIIFWDMNQGNQVKKITAHGGGVLALDYANNGELVSVGRDKRVKVWKADLSLKKQSEPFSELVTEVCFSQDAKRFFTADWNGIISVWDSETMQKIREITATPPRINDRLDLLTQKRPTISAELSEKKKKLDSLRAVVEQAKVKAAESQRSHQESLAKEQGLSTQIETLTATLKQLENSITEKQNATRAAYSKPVMDAQVHQKMLSERAELLQQQEVAQNEIQTASTDLQTKSNQLQSLKQELNKDPNQQEKQKQLADLEQAIRDQRKFIDDRRASLMNLTGKFEKANQDIKSSLDALIVSNATVSLLQNESQTLKEEQEETIQARRLLETELVAQKKQTAEFFTKSSVSQKELEQALSEEKPISEDFEASRLALTDLDTAIKKWNAAAINTQLIQAQSLLEELKGDLPALKEENPEQAQTLEQKISLQDQAVAELLVQYQQAK